MSRNIYKFEDFTLDCSKRQFLFKNDEIELSSKAFEILSLLVRNSGAVVSKDEIFEKIWAGSFVEENNLAVHISAIRKIFRERKGDRDFIKTVSGSGYIFTEKVEEIDGNLSEFPNKIPISQDSFAEKYNAEAQDLVFKGKYIVETVATRSNIKEDLYQAIDFFTNAIKLEPDFVEAYVRIGHAFIQLNNFSHISREDAFQKCKILLQQVFSMGNQSAEFFYFAGIISFHLELDARKAIENYLKVLEVSDNNSEVHNDLAIVQVLLGDFESAKIHYLKAIRQQPNSIRHRNGMIRIYYYSWDFNRAIIKAREVLEMDSRAFSALFLLASCYAEMGIYDEALKFINRAIEILDIPEIRFKRAYILTLMNQPEEGEKLIAEIGDDEEKLVDSLLPIAALYTAQKKFENAFELLQKYYRKADYTILSLRVDPRFRPLRNDKRFYDLLRHFNLL